MWFDQNVMTLPDFHLKPMATALGLRSLRSQHRIILSQAWIDTHCFRRSHVVVVCVSSCPCWRNAGGENEGGCRDVDVGGVADVFQVSA